MKVSVHQAFFPRCWMLCFLLMPGAASLGCLQAGATVGVTASDLGVFAPAFTDPNKSVDGVASKTWPSPGRLSLETGSVSSNKGSGQTSIPTLCGVLNEPVVLVAEVCDAVGFWDVRLGPDTDLAQFDDPTAPGTLFNPTLPGTYQLRWKTYLGGCVPGPWLIEVTVPDPVKAPIVGAAAAPGLENAVYLGTLANAQTLLITGDGPTTLMVVDRAGDMSTVATVDALPILQDIVRFSDQIFWVSRTTKTLWRSDGTAGGTGSVNASLQNVRHLTAFEHGVFFFADNAGVSQLAFFSDGTDVGTRAVIDSATRGDQLVDVPGLAGFFRAADGNVFFFTNTGTEQMSLWHVAGNGVSPVSVFSFDVPSQNAVAAVLTEDPVLLFQLDQDLYAARGDEQDLTPIYQGVFRYQVSLERGAVFSLAADRIATVDGTGVLTTVDEPHLPTILDEVSGQWVSSENDRDFQIAQTTFISWRYLGNLGGRLLFQDLNRQIQARSATGPQSTQLVHDPELVVAFPEPVLLGGYVYFWAYDAKSRTYSLVRSRGTARSVDVVTTLAVDAQPDWVRSQGDDLVWSSVSPGQGSELGRFNGACVVTEMRSEQSGLLTFQMERDGSLAVLDATGSDLLRWWWRPGGFEGRVMDPHLEAALLAVADGDQDGRLSEVELAEVTHLDLEGLGLTRLNGIESLPNLAYLNAAENLIADLRPLLNHPRFGRSAEHLVDLSFNPLSSDNCVILSVLNVRFAQGRLVLDPALVPNAPWSFTSWPRSNVLILLKPGWVERATPFCTFVR